LRFETGASKPPMFRRTEPPIISAQARSGLAKDTLSDEDLAIWYSPTPRLGAGPRIDPVRGY
jgi:hypothetical protein